ncbi:hypothetical protein JW962_00415 [Candidatus Dojkabacteria bacterium]|nr:hypothetical protein [Candidatus Dojkabacteria bacterium]
MKIYLTYKFGGQSVKEVKSLLEKISKIFEETGHSTYIYLRDEEDWGRIQDSEEEVMLKAFSKIKECDMLVNIVSKGGVGRGMCLEAGFAKGVGLKVVTIVIGETEELGHLGFISDKVIKVNEFGEFSKDIVFDLLSNTPQR